MDFKKILLDKIIRSIEKENNKNKIEVSKDTPIVIFNDKKLQIAIGMWLDIIPSYKILDIDGFNYLYHLDSSKLLEIIPQSNQDQIEEVFGLILSKIGIDPTEICIIDYYNEENFSFNCHLITTKENITITLEEELHSKKEVTITYHNYKKTYSYDKEDGETPNNLKLKGIEITNPITFTTFSNYICKYFYGLIIKNEDNEVYIKIDYPKDLDKTDNNPYINKLEENLFNITFPTTTEEIYQQIEKSLLKDITNYPKITISLIQKESDTKVVRTLRSNKGNIITKIGIFESDYLYQISNLFKNPNKIKVDLPLITTTKLSKKLTKKADK